MFSSTIFLWASSFAFGVIAVPAPGPCTGSCGTHDPSLVRRVSDGTYFRFTTNGHVGTASAPSISGPWTNRGAALPGNVKLSQGNDIWAPDVSLVGSTYHMYYAVSSFGSQKSGIGLATSTTLEPGSWTDHGSIGLDSAAGKPYNSIDPNLVKSGDDYYLNLGSFWGDIYQARLSASLTSPATTPAQMIYNPAGSHSIEGSFAFQNGNYFYMFWSAGQCCSLNTSKPPAGGEYMIKVCRSSSVTGPYVDDTGASCTKGGGTIVLKSHDNIYAPGGQGVINDPKYGPVLYYHYMNTNVGISDGQTIFGWNPLVFSSGWPVVQASTYTPGTTPSSTLATSVKSTTSAKSTTTVVKVTSTTGSGSGAPLYGQCGGDGFIGPKTCASGTCTFSSQWYSQVSN